MTKVTIRMQAETALMQIFPLSPDAIRALRAPNDTPSVKHVVAENDTSEGHSRLVRPASSDF